MVPSKPAQETVIADGGMGSWRDATKSDTAGSQVTSCLVKTGWGQVHGDPTRWNGNPEFLMADRTRCALLKPRAFHDLGQGNPPDTSVSDDPQPVDTRHSCTKYEDSKPITSGGSLVAWRFWSQAQRR